MSPQPCARHKPGIEDRVRPEPTTHETMKTTLAALINSTSIPEALVRAVVRQSGGWRGFKDRAEDVANHGADSGFSGFTYYTDTLEFTRANLTEIKTTCRTMAEDFGTEGGIVAFVKGFNCLKSATEDEIGATLFGKGDENTDVGNALAWFALEEVARAYVDLIER